MFSTIFIVASLFLAPPTTQPMTRFTDFDNAAANARWRMVNDKVMGGRSKGDIAFDDGVMTFAGSINTNGGGFSSTRLRIEPGELQESTHVQLRIKTDGRPYRFLVVDDRPMGDNRILHRQELATDPAVPADEWQTVEVDLRRMTPSLRGDPVEAEPLDVSRAIEIGFILNDTGDGPFELKIDAIDLVQP